MARDARLRRRLHALIIILLASSLAPAQTLTLSGSVTDPEGAAIAGAEVTLSSGAYSFSTSTDSAGRFQFTSVTVANGKLRIRAAGFSDAHRVWNANDISPIKLTLLPAPNSERVTVTATRIASRTEDVAANAVALSAHDLAATPALLIDDKLRQVPGFTLFRRSSSRTSNPTSQGVSLNGLGASGASRALVLEDGVPINDPFGGWIYWSRIPPAELADVEVIRGGISSLYGSNAMAGVIQFLSRQPETPAMSLELSYGSEVTPDLSFWSGARAGKWDGAVSADLFHSDGYVLVPVEQRGTVDSSANAEHAGMNATVGRSMEKARVFARGSYFTEGRHNGTLIQVNDTQSGEGILGAELHALAIGTFSLRAFGMAQSYNQSFSSVTADRNCQSLTNLQHVPSQQVGGSALWSRSLRSRQTLVAGVDVAQVIGSSNERLFLSTGTCPGVMPNGTNVSGGRQRTFGVYGEDIIRVSPSWIITPGLRVDRWRNFDAESLRTPVAGPPVSTPSDDRSENAISPRLSVLHQINDKFAVTGAAYRAFRSPTLNELYRSFRLGNVLTEANSALRAERLTGAEAGVNAYAFERRFQLHSTFFWNDVVNPVANVTLSSTTSPVIRQRQNLGRTRSRGLDVDSSFSVSSTTSLSGGYQLVDAIVLSEALNGLRIPEVPRHQFTLRAQYWNPARIMLSAQARYSGAQFDDDLNQLKLEHYFVLDLYAGRALNKHLEAFVAIENALNQRFDVSLTPSTVPGSSPVRTLGPPFLARVGMRLKLGGL
ncbi:MAG: hypothetical protein DMG90_12655 [Acidobacteria bacterium]|nr:MAG: hypothetical protein DMG90_12655 [Acidobacteriota bacterium]